MNAQVVAELTPTHGRLAMSIEALDRVSVVPLAVTPLGIAFSAETRELYNEWRQQHGDRHQALLEASMETLLSMGSHVANMVERFADTLSWKDPYLETSCHSG